MNTLLEIHYLEVMRHPFTLGLLLGLLVAGFFWKNGFTATRTAKREIKRLELEQKELQNHLNTQLKINASGNETLQKELETLKQQNETLRVNNATLHNKPGRNEQRLLHVYEIAIRTMREQAPGFAQAWEKAIRQAEGEVDAAESGLKKLVRRVIPGLSGPTQGAVIVSEDPPAEKE
ncbi:MAG: hypothetical protein H7A50_09625 [Akkermansiaceae bacterium]|nr:hypothetical protein [Akkermansiaceae bacterium]